MQPRRSLDWQIRRLLRKHPAPTPQLKEELWKGIAATLDERQPVKSVHRKRAILGIAALFLLSFATALVVWQDQKVPLVQNLENFILPELSQKNPSGSGSGDLANNTEYTANKAGGRTVKSSPKSAIIYESSGIKTVKQKEENRTGNKDLTTQTGTRLSAVLIRAQNLNILAPSNPLMPAHLGKYKRKQVFVNTASSTWSSLLLNIWDNPAFTGGSARVSLTYDDQMSFFDNWRSGIYQNVFAADGRIPNTPFSVGLYHERAANSFSLKTGTAITLSARLLKVGSGYLALGGGVSALSKRFFSNTLHYSDQFDPTFGFSEVTKQRQFTSRNSAIGIDAGAWYQGKNLIAGISVKNANEPLFGYTEQGERLRRTLHFNGGYRVAFGRVQLLPLVELKRNEIYTQGGASLLLTFADKLTIGGGYQNISPVTLRGDRMAYAALKAFNKLTIFTSYGRSGEMASKGIHRHLVHTGIRFQVN